MTKFFLIGAVTINALFGVAAEAAPVSGPAAIQGVWGTVVQKVWCDWYCRHRHYWHHDSDHYNNGYRHRDSDRDHNRERDRDYRYRDHDRDRNYDHHSWH
jgi:hypothetical protein